MLEKGSRRLGVFIKFQTLSLFNGQIFRQLLRKINKFDTNHVAYIYLKYYNNSNNNIKIRAT